MSNDLEEKIEELELEMHGAHGDLYLCLVKIVTYFFGSALAIVVSYSESHSILWAILHGILSWGYVLYYSLFK